MGKKSNHLANTNISPPASPINDREDGPPSVKSSKSFLDHVEFLATYLPTSLRVPVVSITATLLLVVVLGPLVKRAGMQTQGLFAWVTGGNVAGAIILGLILLIVLLAWAFEQRSRKQGKA